MRNFFQRLMYGRYGVDALNNAMLALCLVLMVLGRLFRIGLLDLLSVVVLVVCYFRVFSRNIPARYRENQKFLAASQPVRKWFIIMKMRFHDRKTHCYFSCPNCGMTLRVPKGKGVINICCPKCQKQFIEKT